MLPGPPEWILAAAFLGWLALTWALRLDRLVSLEQGRIASVDGLRGILALMVYCHHFAIARQFQATHVWTITTSPAWGRLGAVGVTVFFMITGFLFIGKIRRGRGRVAVPSFFAGRVVRLVPVYAATVAIVALVAFLVRDPADPGTAIQTLRSLVRWAMLGAGPLFGVPDTGRIIAYVTWTLQYEWLFYAALPATAVLWGALRLRAWPILAITALWLVLARYPVMIPVLQLSTISFAPFALGGCIALVRPDSRPAAHLRGPAGLLLSSLALAAVFLTPLGRHVVASYLLLAAAFAPIALGNDVFGLLRLRSAQVLGLVSYDIYLLHGIVLYVGYAILAPRALETENAAEIAVHLLGAGFIAILLSLAMHRLVEWPAQQAGARWLRPVGPVPAVTAPSR